MTTTTISDLSPELVEEILSKVPLTSLSSVRSTCKTWNVLSKHRMICKGEVKQQFLGFIMMDSKVCSLRYDLQNKDCDFSDLSIKQIDKLSHMIVSYVLHCDGLLLCVNEDYSRLVVWNPYIGKTRSFEPRTVIDHKIAKYVNRYGFGYDSRRRQKILTFSEFNTTLVEYEIYDLDSDSWRIVDVTSCLIIDYYHRRGVSLKGNTYWIALDVSRTDDEWEEEKEEEYQDYYLLCFDFTRERFGPGLKLPFHHRESWRALSCVREEQIALLLQRTDSCKMEVWVTTKIEPESVSWTKFLAFDMRPVFRHFGLGQAIIHGSFFIDKDKKIAVLFGLGFQDTETPRRNIAYIIGEDGYYMEVDLGESSRFGFPIVCSYVPSLAQIEHNE
ncbi:unnamed protein product [Cochlearia groenlandica]